MIFKNSSSPNSDNQEIKIKSIKFSYKENFKSEQKSFLNESEFIENYNKRSNNLNQEDYIKY